MIFILFLFFSSLLLGQLGSISIIPGVTIYTHDVVLALVYIVFFFRQRNVFPKFKGRILRPFFLFIFIGIVSLVVNFDRYPFQDLLQGSLYLWRFLFYGLLYLVVRNESVSRQTWRIGLYCFGVGLALLGFIQYFYYPSLRNLLYLGWDEHFYRLFSTLLDPNFVGILLVLTFILGMHFLEKRKVLLFLTQTIVGLALLLTYSRSSFLAIGIALSIWAIRAKQKMFFALFVVAAVVYSFLPGHGIDANRVLRVESTLARISNWEQSVPLFLKSPFIGIGFNMLRAQAKIDRPGLDEVYISRDAAGLNSSVLVILVTTGVVGLVSFFYLFKSVLIIISERKDSMRLIGLTSLIAIFVHSFFNNTMFYSWVMIWVWILVGAIEEDQKIKKTETPPGVRKRNK